MKLRTSFFNSRVFCKNLTRFAPVWVLYTVAEVLCLLTLNLENPALVAENINTVMGPVSVCHGVYALIVAACLFGDLFDSRMCNGLHAMPMRREGWLLTSLASGLVFALVPALAGGAVAAVAMGKYWWIAVVWQAVSLLQFVFFFGIAAFSAMCAGKRLGMIAVYAMVNFLSLLIYWAATLFYQPLLPGVVMPEETFFRFCPVVSMAGDVYLSYYYDWILGGFFKGFIPQAWNYLYICTCVGVIFTVLAWLLYRRRHLETAGDFISFRPMRIVFLLAYTFAMGALVYSFTGVFFGMTSSYSFLAVGILIGWFTGWMLLERTAKIFTKKVLIGLAVFGVLFAGSIGLTVWDPVGITTYVPQTKTVDYACMYLQKDAYYYNSDDSYLDGWRITDATQIDQVRDLHRQMIQNGEDSGEEYMTVYVDYRLQSGRTVCRRYEVPADSETAESLQPFFSNVKSVFIGEDWQNIRSDVFYCCVYWTGDRRATEMSDRKQMQKLLDAIEADCAAGKFAQHDYFHRHQEFAASIDINWKVPDAHGGTSQTRGEHVVIYTDCVNTLAFLETLEER